MSGRSLCDDTIKFQVAFQRFLDACFPRIEETPYTAPRGVPPQPPPFLILFFPPGLSPFLFFIDRFVSSSLSNSFFASLFPFQGALNFLSLPQSIRSFPQSGPFPPPLETFRHPPPPEIDLSRASTLACPARGRPSPFRHTGKEAFGFSTFSPGRRRQRGCDASRLLPPRSILLEERGYLFFSRRAEMFYCLATRATAL